MPLEGTVWLWNFSYIYWRILNYLLVVLDCFTVHLSTHVVSLCCILFTVFISTYLVVFLAFMSERMCLAVYTTDYYMFHWMHCSVEYSLVFIVLTKVLSLCTHHSIYDSLFMMLACAIYFAVCYVSLRHYVQSLSCFLSWFDWLILIPYISMYAAVLLPWQCAVKATSWRLYLVLKLLNSSTYCANINDLLDSSFNFISPIKLTWVVSWKAMHTRAIKQVILLAPYTS